MMSDISKKTVLSMEKSSSQQHFCKTETKTEQGKDNALLNSKLINLMVLNDPKQLPILFKGTSEQLLLLSNTTDISAGEKIFVLQSKLVFRIRLF